MADNLYLMTSEAGVSHYMVLDEHGAFVGFRSVGETDPIVERNKAMATHNDGYSPSREMRRVASIPMILIAKWKNEEGWDALDPACADRLMKKMNDPEYHYLRTADGQLGMSNGVMR